MAQYGQPPCINPFNQTFLQTNEEVNCTESSPQIVFPGLSILITPWAGTHQDEGLVVHVQSRVELPQVGDHGGNEDGGRRVRRREVEATLVRDHGQH